jgi:hypothetical protein
MGNAVHEALLPRFQTGRRRGESQSSGRRKRRDMKFLHKGAGGGGGAGVSAEEDEKAEVERKIEALQRIVPGGESLGLDKLFEETAGYIMTLQCQVKALRTLSSFFEALEKEKRKLGG